MATTRLMPLHSGKGRTVAEALGRVTDYVENPEKTNGGDLVTASERLSVEELKTLVWRYFMSYWNRRRICSANGGLPPAVKRQRYFAALAAAA